MSRRPVAFAGFRSAAPPAAPIDPLIPALRPLPIQLHEVLGFNARYLAALPLPATLLCSQAHGGERLALQTAASAPEVAGALAFVGPELAALILAAENERANAAVLAIWCARKAAEARWRLTQVEAIGGLGEKPAPRGWAVERVLWALGLRLEEVLA